MSITMLVLLVLAGVAAGFLNTLAGGGTLIALPVLLLVGLPADIANATSRLGVLVQSIAGAHGFGAEGKVDRRVATWIVVPTVFGGLLGAMIASRVPASVMKPILIVTLFGIAVMLMARPQTVAADSGSVSIDPRTRPFALVLLFGAGIYGGFLQASMGIILLSLLGGLLQFDLIRANALKSIAIGALTFAALLVFVIERKVAWLPGIALSIGTAVGAKLAVRFAIAKGQRVVMRVVLLAVLGSGLAVLFK